ncbi:hypothetical protein BH11ARM2_BH11ARM2_25220 [soil metagenome]
MATIPFTNALKAEYENLFQTCRVRPERLAEVEATCTQMLAHQARYEGVQNAANGVPWYVIAITHYRECSLRFDEHLHNGDPLTRRTTHVPPNRPQAPPKSGHFPYTFEESALDALTVRGFSRQTDWSLAHTLYFFETYNGVGYRLYHPYVLSPYLWCFTNHYTSGGYPRDGVWSDSYVNKQCGTAALLRRLAERGAIEFGTDGEIVPGGAASPWDQFEGVRYNPNHVVELARQLQHALNTIPGIHLVEDGEAGQRTSDALKKVTGHYLLGDPRG